MKHATLYRRLSLLLALLACGSVLSAEVPASLILVNGRIYTMNPTQPWAEAIAVRGDRIAAVGAGADVLRLKGPSTQIMDLQRGFLTPGLIDSHVHFYDGGCLLRK
jgi:predicted amidohydrolase YtcJ